MSEKSIGRGQQRIEPEPPKTGMIEGALGKPDAVMVSHAEESLAKTNKHFDENLDAMVLISGVNAILDEDNNVHLRTHRVRDTETPVSAVWHLELDGKEYLLILQPTDMP